MAASKAVVEAFAGGVGSLVALFSTYPLKTIYTLQAIRAVKQNEGTITKERAHTLWTDPVACISALCHQLHPNQLAVLYSGLQPAAVETTCSSAIYFYFYSLLRQAVVSFNRRRAAAAGGANASLASSSSSRTEDIGVVASLLVAALAGAGNQLITTPAQVVTTQMQARCKAKQQLEEAGQPSGHIRADTWGVVQQIWREKGLLGFWQGLAPSLVLVVNPAIQYCAYEWMTQRTMQYKAASIARAATTAAAAVAGGPGVAHTARALAAGSGRSSSSGALSVKLSPGEVFLLGAGAKIIATIVTYPMIVVKSRLQAMGEHTAAENRYGGTGDAIRRIWKEEGAGGFFKGMNAKLLQTALNAALMLSIKEQVYTGTAAALNALGGLSAAKQQLAQQARQGGVLPVVQAGAQAAMAVPVVLKKPAA